MNMDGAGGETDYSDFEYEQITAALEVDGDEDSTTNPNAYAVHTFNPLDAIGGLDNNEVAELVYLETTVTLEYEDEVDDQDVGTTAETRGIVGVNLSTGGRADFLNANIGAEQTDGQAQVAETFNDTLDENIGVANSQKAEDRILQLFAANGGLPFDDQTNGPGGAGTHEQFYAEKKWRDLTGRGPVLDQSDDFCIGQTVNVSDTIIPVVGTVRCHLVWDVAETSDAGRRFSVPF
jgi:hypothetical protein